ncbi:MAG: hypothetical protein JWO36_3774 [Myxococcales bacterium]|nr:hypothetical protein [Myxococcales bacterium]
MSMRRLALGLSLLTFAAGCDKPRELANDPVITTAGKPLPGVPAVLADRLGAADTVGVVHLGKWRENVAKLVPAPLRCVRDLIMSLDTLVLAARVETGDWHVLSTGLPKLATRDCIAEIAPMFGVTMSTSALHYEIGFGDTTVSIAWDHGITVVERAGHPFPPGEPIARLRALVSELPKDVELWIAAKMPKSYPSPDGVVTDVAGWLTFDAEHPGFSMRIYGDARAHQAVLDGVHQYVRKVEAKGIHIEDDWIHVAYSGDRMTVDVSFPLDIFARLVPHGAP